MSEITLTTWTCDRCKTDEEMLPPHQPDDWVSVYLVTPPRAEVSAQYISTKVHLCGECRADFHTFLEGPR